MIRSAAALLIVILAAVAPARADELMRLPAPEELSRGEGAAFRKCQLAVIYERSATDKTVLSTAFVETMEDQIEFILSDTVFNLPALSYDDSIMRLRFVEKWFVGFGRDMTMAQPFLSDPAVRGQTLLDCQPLIWGIVRNHIRTLIDWRTRAIGAQTAPQLDFADPAAQ